MTNYSVFEHFTNYILNCSLSKDEYTSRIVFQSFWMLNFLGFNLLINGNMNTMDVQC